MLTLNSRKSTIREWKRILLAILILYILAILSSCEYNHQEEVLPEGAINPCDTAAAKFNSNVMPILTAKCATSGCHDGTGDDPNLSSDFYNQLSSSLSDGKFKTKVIDGRTMPPVSATPLTAEEYLQLKCWYENGHLNN